MKRLLPTLLAAVVVFLLAGIGFRSLAVVDETQYVLITEFGRPVAVYGDEAGESGLHWKWPWQSAESIDRRVEVVDVRLRRYNFPIEVRPAVFDLIRSERRQVAETLRAEGEAEYQSLTSQADRKRDEILAQADAEAERIRGQGEAEATRIYNA